MKSKLKKSLSLLLALVMAMSCMSLGAFAEVESRTVTFLLRDEVGDMTIQYDKSVYEIHTQDGVQRSGAAVYNNMTQTVANGNPATEPTGEPSYWYHSGKTFPVGDNTGIPFTVEQSQAYVFDGWRLQGENVRYDFSTPVTSDITLVPHFSAVEAVFEINTEEDLFAFAREVTLGRSYRSKVGGAPRQTVKLMNNITLTSNWTPIPGNFHGIFDGNGYAISGLVINDTTNAETGFFRTSGKSGNGFVVTDLTFQNPSVTSSGSFVGVLVGQADCVTVTNVTVNNPTVLSTSTDNVGGLVGSLNNNVGDDSASASVFSGCSVNGGTISCTGSDGRMVGGLFGQAHRNITVTNCSVSNVTINGYRKLGGLIGQANGAHLTCTDASVSGVTLNALGDTSYAKDLTMGGLVGLFATPTESTFTGTVSDITMTGPESIASGKNYIMGLVSGGTGGTVEAAETAMTGANMTFDVTVSGTNSCTVPNDCTYAGIKGSGVAPAVTYVARIEGGDQYETLAEAVAAVPTDGTATTITVLRNIDLGTGKSNLLEIPATANLTLDLNGFVISGSTTGTGPRILKNEGTLVIKDSSMEKTGEIKNISDGNNDCTRTLGNGTDDNHTATMIIESGTISSTVGQVIINQGNLTIKEDAVLETTANYSGNYSNGAVVLDNRSAGVVEIDGATLTSDNGMLMYVFSGSNVTIKGGKFTAKATRGLIGGTGAAAVKISGGTFNIDPSAMVKQGYCAVKENVLYTVVEMEEETSVTVSSVDQLSQALATAKISKPVRITINGNINVYSTLELIKGSTIVIPNGNSLTIADDGVLIVNGIVENEGTLTIAKNGFLSNPLSVQGEGEYIYNGYNPGAETYSISTPMDLQWLAVVNSGDTIDDLTVELADDVTFPEDVVFQQIPYFCGVFDGRNHTISGLVLNGVSSYTSVFGGMSSATIKNVTFDETITSNNGTVGGIVGYINDDTHFENVKTTGSITVEGSGYGAAGFVGVVSGTDATGTITFENCESNMTISAPNASIVGGFYGTATSNKTPINVKDCTFSGKMTSGGYCCTVGGYLSSNSTGKTYVYGHAIKGTVSGGYSTGKKLDGVMVLGADGYGEVKAQKAASVGTTIYETVGEAITAAHSGKKALFLHQNMTDAVNVELTGDDDVFIVQNNGKTANLNVTLQGEAEGKEVKTRTDTNITVYYVGDATPTYVAQIGDVKYETLQDAIAAASNGDTIELLRNIELASEVIVTTTGENVHQTSNFNIDQIASKKLSSLTIDGDGRTISMPSQHAYGGKYTLSGQSAFFFGAYSNDANSSITGNVYTLKNITFTGFNCMIIHAKKCTVNLEGCMFQNNHVTVGLGSGSSTDMIETLNAALKIDGCTFTGNTTTGKYALIYTNNQVADSTVTISNNLFENNGTAQEPVGGNGLALLSNVASSNDAVTDNTFTGNYITMADGNAAVIYASQPVETITGNLFTGNYVTAPSNNKAGAIVLGSGTTGSVVTGNAFVDNTLAGATQKIATMVVGSASNISNNYWNDGDEPKIGTSKDIYLDGNPAVTNTNYATAYAANSNGRGCTVTLADTFVGYTDEQILQNDNLVEADDGTVIELVPKAGADAEADAAYAAEKVSENVVTKYTVKVAETVPDVTDAVETEASVSSVNTTSVIAKAKTSASNAISVGGTNTIELFVKADNLNTTTDTITYEVDPYAIVNGDASNPVELSNSDLSSSASFTFKVAAPEGATKVDVVHSWTETIDGKTSETFKNQPVVNGYVTVTLTHFSSLEVTTVSTEVVPTSTNTKILGMNGWFADFFVLNIYVQTDVENPTFTLNREFESIGDFEQVTSRAAFCEANKAVFYVEKVSNNGTNALGLNSTRSEECYMISVKFFTRYLDKAVTLTMKDGSETVYIQGYQYQNIGSNEIASSHAYSFIDYLNIMATYKTGTGAADANAYANLYQGLQLAAQGAQGLAKS